MSAVAHGPLVLSLLNNEARGTSSEKGGNLIAKYFHSFKDFLFFLNQCVRILPKIFPPFASEAKLCRQEVALSYLKIY